MKRASANTLCPCGSGSKYKKCCRKYHQGALPKTAEALMRSRYSAYVFGLADYIMATTHPDNPDFTQNRVSWRDDILLFCRHTDFLKLTVTSAREGETEAFVSFQAELSSGLMREKSRFLKEEGRWLYVDGIWEY
jgi:SEC-C motif-containing protein